MRTAPSLRLALGLASGLALAGAGPAAGEPPTADRLGAAPLRAGEGWVGLTYELSLSTRLAGEPWALGLDGALALGPRLTVGVSQSAAALGTVDRGGGWCLDSGAHACPQRYRGGLVDLRWRVIDGDASLTALARAGVAGLAPVLPLARLGLRGQARRGRWWGVAQGELAMSLGRRALGNRDTLEAPVWLGLDAGPVSAWLRTGVRGELAGLGDKLEVPVGLGVMVARGHLRAGVDAGWPQLLGPQNSFKQRQAALWLAVER